MASEPDRQIRLVTKYNVYCPCSDKCTKGNRTLGSYWSSKANRSKANPRGSVFKHMTMSTVHEMDEETARAWTDRASETWQI